jgi:hypothetical protein
MSTLRREDLLSQYMGFELVLARLNGEIIDRVNLMNDTKREMRKVRKQLRKLRKEERR